MSQLGIATSILTLIEKSLAAYRAITAAKNFGSDAAHTVMMLRFEAFRYAEWARENRNIAALHVDAPSRQPTTVALPAKAVRASPAVSAKEALYDAIIQVIEVLQEIDSLLTKYDRAFESREHKDSSVLSGLASVPVPIDHGLQVDTAKAAEKFRYLKDDLQSKVSFGRRVKYGIQTWNEPDKETLKSLTARFKYWNDALAEIAPPHKRNLFEVKLSSDVVGPAEAPGDLRSIEAAAQESQYQSVWRSARFKRTKAQMPLSSTSLEREYGDVNMDTSVSRSRRFLTTYQTSARDYPPGYQPAQRVIVEWYYYDEKWTTNQVDLANSRVEELAQQFSVNDKPPNLRVLDCLGYICHPQKHDRALLYEVSTLGAVRQPVSMFEILSPAKRSQNPNQTPSLNSRFRLAGLLATSVLELHNVSWLHKNLNSYNLLFFVNEHGDVSFTEPYITGFDFSRPDKPGQKSLSTRPSPLDIYRHPDIRKVTPSSKEPQSYERKYDVYSLGLILYEIALWKRLDEFMKPNLTPEQFRERIESYVNRDVSLWMGDIYKRVILACLSGSYLEEPGAIPLDRENSEPAVIEESDMTGLSTISKTAVELNGFYRHVVAELGRCHCGAANGWFS